MIATTVYVSLAYFVGYNFFLKENKSAGTVLLFLGSPLTVPAFGTLLLVAG